MNLANKNKGKAVSRKYSVDLRKFALTLNFYSPKTYEFVRNEFNCVLPHPRTLGKWYCHMDAEPGFTQESLDLLTLKNDKPIYCALMIDEVAIRQHVEWDGFKYHGYVNIGKTVETDTMEVATECLVFMVVCINEPWKLPIGYFLCNHLSSVQKAELVKQALNLLQKTKVNIVSLTFDGCPTNLTMSKILGCDLNLKNLKTDFSVNNSNEPVVILPDPAHMIKLVRNTFGEKQLLLNSNNEQINFKFIKELLTLQENEGFHLGNKLKKNHVFFFRQKMKVKLATQLLSKSVADTLSFCQNTLKLEAFQNCNATIEFIQIFNNAFDILNSRKYNDYGFKSALCDRNFEEIKNCIDEISTYIKGLKFPNGQLVIESPRKTGFLGFLICFESLKTLYETLLKSKKLKFLCFYKFSQDHLELLFGSIRSHGGLNNNPTARQFRATYKKLIMHAEIKNSALGNCIPLDNISILNCSSIKNKEPEDLINSTYLTLYKDIELEPETLTINDHDYIVNNTLNDFCTEVIIYIAGFVSRHLSFKIKCEICVGALFGVKDNFLGSLIHLKDVGGLSYPSDSVIFICTKTEKIMRSFQHQSNKPMHKLFIQTKTLNFFINNTSVFNDIQFHNFDNDCMSNHVTLLIKSIISKYFDLKTKYTCKKSSENISLRNWYNKMILFKGQ